MTWTRLSGRIHFSKAAWTSAAVSFTYWRAARVGSSSGRSRSMRGDESLGDVVHARLGQRDLAQQQGLGSCRSRSPTGSVCIRARFCTTISRGLGDIGRIAGIFHVVGPARSLHVELRRDAVDQAGWSRADRERGGSHRTRRRGRDCRVAGRSSRDWIASSPASAASVTLSCTRRASGTATTAGLFAGTGGRSDLRFWSRRLPVAEVLADHRARPSWGVVRPTTTIVVRSGRKTLR